MPNINDRHLKIGTKVPTAIYTASDEPVCIVDSMKERADDAAVARRLAACWNTCLGISTGALEAMPGHFFGAVDAQRNLDAERQRDTLLAAIEKVLDDLRGIYMAEPAADALRQARDEVMGTDTQPGYQPEYCWSFGGETFHGRFDSEAEAVADAKRTRDSYADQSPSVQIGTVRHPTEWIKPSHLGEFLEEHIGERLSDEVGEAAENFTLTPEQREAMGKQVLEFITTGPGFNCWGVENIKTVEFGDAS